MPALTYAVGDIHGCRRLYRQMEQAIIDDALCQDIGGPKLIVLLGDVVDRGPDSAGLVADLLKPPPPGFQRVVLRGNHEDKMHAFLDHPDKHLNWLAWGGVETLASYGLYELPDQTNRISGRHLQAQLDAAIPGEHREFIAGLPHGLLLENYFFSHAGFDPGRPIDEQDPDALIWGNPDRLDAHATDIVSVHGHKIVAAPFVSEKRINVDTGAYESGHLSAVRLQPCKPPVALGVQGDPR